MPRSAAFLGIMLLLAASAAADPGMPLASAASASLKNAPGDVEGVEKEHSGVAEAVRLSPATGESLTRSATPSRRRKGAFDGRSERTRTWRLWGRWFDVDAPARESFGSLTPLPPSPPSFVVLDNFDAGSSSGSVVAGSSWAGNITPGATALSVGGTATNVNGWGAAVAGGLVDLSRMNYLVITARNDGSAAGTSLKIEFEDLRLSQPNYVVNVSLTLFASGLNQVQVPFGYNDPNFAATFAGFDLTQVTAWRIGGGGLGDLGFAMTFGDLSLSASAIPEPSTVALGLGLAATGAACVARRRRAAHTASQFRHREEPLP